MLREPAPARYSTDISSADAIKTAATAYVQRHFLLFEQELGDGPYLLGPQVSMFDIYLWMLVFWVDPDWLAPHCPKVHRFWSQTQTRPVLARVAGQHFG